jgi:hypothetical protein
MRKFLLFLRSSGKRVKRKGHARARLNFGEIDILFGKRGSCQRQGSNSGEDAINREAKPIPNISNFRR